MDMDDQSTGAASAGYSRRDVLKKGAVVGGTLAWAVPAVQLISMTSASAESPSAPPSQGQPPAQGQTPAGGQKPATQVAGSSDSSLAYTGFPVAPVVAGGAGLVAAGLAAGAVARKRATDTAEESGSAPA